MTLIAGFKQDDKMYVIADGWEIDQTKKFTWFVANQKMQKIFIFTLTEGRNLILAIAGLTGITNHKNGEKVFDLNGIMLKLSRNTYANSEEIITAISYKIFEIINKPELPKDIFNYTIRLIIFDKTKPDWFQEIDFNFYTITRFDKTTLDIINNKRSNESNKSEVSFYSSRILPNIANYIDYLNGKDNLLAISSGQTLTAKMKLSDLIIEFNRINQENAKEFKVINPNTHDIGEALYIVKHSNNDLPKIINLNSILSKVKAKFRLIKSKLKVLNKS